MEGHLLSTVKEMMHFYTNEVFEKVKETQTQINTNDKGLSKMLTAYVKQLTDQNHEYADKQNKDIANFVIPPLQKIQEDIGIVNGNLDIMHGWLTSNEVLNPPEPELLQNKNTHNDSLTVLKDSLGDAAHAALDLIHGLHTNVKDSEGLDEE